MSRLRADRRLSPPRLLAAGLALMATGAGVAGCSEVPSNVVESQPYKTEEVKGSDIKRVKLSDAIAANLGLQTARVAAEGSRKVVPHAALIYSPEGQVFVYTRPERGTYVRARVSVADVDGDRAVLTKGPSSGTEIVTTGAAELLATEYEILNQHP